MPMPLEGLPLVVEPLYPRAKEISAIGAPEPRELIEGEAPPPERKVINHWWSDRDRGEIVIYEVAGKRTWGIVHQVHNADKTLAALGAADAWGIEQESRAINLLGSLIGHRPFKQYMLTGMFPERSRRSGLTYIFRRLRPTIVLDARDEQGTGPTRILAALCLHPIAYYSGSWAGAMVPTDDVVAHLMLMRGDEPMFWRRSSQHAAWRPEAGL